MVVVTLGAKAAVAVLLLVAGGAKLADVAGFAAAIQLFVPARVSPRLRTRLPAASAALALTELLTGAASLCLPADRWLNWLVLALACGFVVVATVGYARHRGRPCRCFGALTRRSFGVRTLGQALLIAVVAGLAVRPVRTAQLDLGLAAHLLLLAAASLVTLAAFTAARALASGNAQPGMAA
ncbi:MAG: MauE/DoxX family redox-associated membrane protein [Streptosporangiaceae bacterium]